MSSTTPVSGDEPDEYTAAQLAEKVLDSAGLLKSDEAHVALVLTQLARQGMRVIRPEDVFPEVMHGGTVSRLFVAELVYALTGAGFSATCRNDGRELLFRLIAFVTFPRVPRAEFDALHVGTG